MVAQIPSVFPAREGHIEVRVPGYEAPVINSDRLVKEAKDGFQPAQMLAFMQRMAVSPWCGEDRVISGIKCVAQVRAYRAAIAVLVTAEYRQALINFEPKTVLEEKRQE